MPDLGDSTLSGLADTCSQVHAYRHGHTHMHTDTQINLKKKLFLKCIYLSFSSLTSQSYWSSVSCYPGRGAAALAEKRRNAIYSGFPFSICWNPRTNEPSSTYWSIIHDLLLMRIIIGCFQNTQRPSGVHHTVLLPILPCLQLLLCLVRHLRGI